MSRMADYAQEQECDMTSIDECEERENLSGANSVNVAQNQGDDDGK